MSVTAPATQPSFVYPERPIYSVASAYGEVFPYTRAVGNALRTQGTRLDKFGTGTDTLTHWLGFRAIYRGFQRWLDKQYTRHPALAETMNRHPILLGLPASIVGLTLAQAGGTVVHRLWRKVRRSQPVETTIEKALHTAPGNALAKLGRPLERLARNPLVRLPMTLLGMGFFLTLAARMVQDRHAFGRAYKQTRRELPREAANPYTARAVALSNLQTRRNPGFQAFQTEAVPNTSASVAALQRPENAFQSAPVNSPGASQFTVSLPSTAGS